MKVLVCGLGSIGMRHVRNLSQLPCQLTVWHYKKLDDHRARTLKESAITLIPNIESALEQSDAVVIATPTDTHHDIASKALILNKHIYFEKPLSNRLFNAEPFLLRDPTIVIEVGCQLRNHPSLVKLKDVLSKDDTPLTYSFVMGHRLEFWRPGNDYQNSFTSDTSRGGGALYELVHMVDLSIMLFGKITAVFCKTYRTRQLSISDEDTCLLTIEHHSGVKGQIQLDMVSPEYRCWVEIVGLNKLYNLSLTEGTLYARSTLSNSEVVSRLDNDHNRNTLFIDHMRHFIKCCTSPLPLPPVCSFEESYHALEVLDAARRSSDEGRMVSILESHDG